ncbi:MAG: hypothetical protein AMQ22_01329 [Candidatus Methanofastidiosum methylothiophilum]|uniref:Uncharacterized protein n=1 Tax=Candidatus Methanofastidiosum methylothiophilum TaxID=1705564 RepID=A0A150J268_9EURY|nr:MAG: hypothetical protein AMQ22_01329 [Candidatus Methanofastidiosum methylthiophilus]
MTTCDNCGREISNTSNTPYANSTLYINEINPDKSLKSKKINLCDICTVAIHYALEELKKHDKKGNLVNQEFIN